MHAYEDREEVKGRQERGGAERLVEWSKSERGGDTTR